MAGAAAAVIAFGFVSISIRFGGGGSGWPLHDVLHPLLGLLLGPVYGALSSVIGASISEVVTPYTALDGMSPLMGGAAALTSGLFVRGGRPWALFLCGAAVVHGGTFAAEGQDGHFFQQALPTLPILVAIVLAGVPQLRAWCRRQLTPSGWSWKTAGALYIVSFVGSAIGLLPLWTAEVTRGSVSGGDLMGPPLY